MNHKISTGSFQVHRWERDARNPVLPPGPAPFDSHCCMNPFAVRVGDEYYLFYAGGNAGGARKICLAISPVGDVSAWRRLGPLFDLGKENAFDADWCVLPCIHRFGSKWHLYYTGRNTRFGLDLQGFTGIGLAVSDDLLHWERFSGEPVLRGDGFAAWPDNRGVAGGGRIVELADAEGKKLYRMHYTLATGVPGGDLLTRQAKTAVTADSYDGVTWFNKQVALSPRLEADYENAAAIALNVWKTASGWRAIYAGIGTRFGAYSICEAESADGLAWQRGEPGENLALAPRGDGWESEMTEYPNVIEEDGRLRLFYCGNGYGRTGIGTAIAEKLSPHS